MSSNVNSASTISGIPLAHKSKACYYQHDENESLSAMTKSITPPPHASSQDSPVPVPLSRPSRSSTVSREGQSQDRIPRRVKSASNWTATTKGKRSPFTTTVSSCLLPNSNSGCGDGASLDPELDVWLDLVPFSRRPRNFHRDFSDGVLMAEMMAHFFPKRVDMHNYVAASAASNKRANWQTLNQKVFSKVGLRFTDALIENIVLAKPGAIERALRQVHRAIGNLDRETLETRAKELSGLAGSFNGGTCLESPFVEELCLVRNTPGEVPDCVIYQNIKYYPSTAFDEISRSEEQLREKNNELCNKVRRLETLLSLKESHLQDLTSKIHELRSKYQSSDNQCFAQDDNGH